MSDEKPKASTFANLVVALIGIAFSLLLVELAFRAVRPLLNAKNKWNDRPYTYLMPSTAQTLQGAQVDAKKSGAFRISVVGDSFTFAPHMQFDDTFPKRLEGFLNLNDGAKRVEVINSGVSGSSTADEVALVRRALDAGSDLIILEITLNDAEPRLLSPAEKRELYDPPAYLNSTFFKIWSSLGFALTRLHNSTTISRYIDYHTKFFKYPSTFKRFDAALAEMANEAKLRSVPLVAVIFPLFDFPINERYPFLESHQIVHQALSSHGIAYLDLLGAYKNIPPERLQVIPVADNHPNEIAHRIAAERLLAFLAVKKLVPAETLPVRAFRHRSNLHERASDLDKAFYRALAEHEPF